MTPKRLITAVLVLVSLITLMFTNPISYNDATERTVVTTLSGEQFVRFQSGTFWSGFFSNEAVYPNQISVSYREDTPDYSLRDATIEIGKLNIRFNDATTAKSSGITQYILPNSEKEMLAMHNAHKSPEALVQRRLAPYTQECLQSASQLLSSEMHYGGGRAQMSQDYLDQLKNGVFLLSVIEVNAYDSIERSNRKIYQVNKTYANGEAKRKFSSVKEYGITVADAQITDVDYEEKVDQMLAKKIDAATKASISKQELMTAQQQQLTAEAQGKSKLVEIEYEQKQEQTKQVVAAQTKVAVAKEDLLQQEIQLQASRKEAEKIKTLAEANAYAKQKAIQADGALDKKLDAYIKVQGYWATALGQYQGNISPSVVSGAGITGNGATNFMELMGIKAAKDLSLDLKNK